MPKITKHAKKRIKERIEPRKRGLALFRLALLKGNSKEEYEKDFFNYLCRKEKSGAKLKVYNDEIYIYSKNSKRLITVYHIPEKFLPIEKYIIEKEKKSKYLIERIDIDKLNEKLYQEMYIAHL